MVFIKNCLASIFKRLVALKRGLKRPNVRYECLSPSPTLSCTITKKKKSFCDAKIIDSPEAPEGPLRVLFRLHRDSVFLRFLSDRVLLNILSDRILFYSSVIGSSSGSSVMGSSLGFITLFYLLSFVFICCTTPSHSLSLVVICYHSLSFVVTRWHSLSLVPLVVICCTTRHSLSLVVTRCTTRLSFTYWFQSEATLYSCLNVKELLARSRREIWSLSDYN